MNKSKADNVVVIDDCLMYCGTTVTKNLIGEGSLLHFVQRGWRHGKV
jgi:hypothetical protein